MSRVEFKKQSCHMSLNSSGPMSPLRCSHVPCRIKKMSHVVSLFCGHVDKPYMSHVDLKKGHVAVSNLGVKGHVYGLL